MARDVSPENGKIRWSIHYSVSLTTERPTLLRRRPPGSPEARLADSDDSAERKLVASKADGAATRVTLGNEGKIRVLRALASGYDDELMLAAETGREYPGF